MKKERLIGGIFVVPIAGTFLVLWETGRGHPFEKAEFMWAVAIFFCLWVLWD